MIPLPSMHGPHRRLLQVLGLLAVAVVSVVAVIEADSSEPSRRQAMVLPIVIGMWGFALVYWLVQLIGRLRGCDPSKSDRIGGPS